MYSIQLIAEIVGGKLHGEAAGTIEHLVYDSRKIQHPRSSLFFALTTTHADGHKYIQDAYKKGVRAFIVKEEVLLENAAIVTVKDPLLALQALAAHHRRQFNYPVIGITGSNGKTVVKEWLYQLLQEEFSIVRSPKSFNSQVGVPLSVWEMSSQHTLGLFEAGISQRGEMEKLQKIIRPTVGVLTTIGEAHSEGFRSNEEKLNEKLLLFKDVDVVIGPGEFLKSWLQHKITWGYHEDASVKIISVTTGKVQTVVEAVYDQQRLVINIPFTDEASIQNALTCLCVLFYFKLSWPLAKERFLSLLPVDMRLQLRHGINNCLLVNDSYSADLTSLKIAMHFMVQQSAGLKRTVILSDFFESGKKDEVLYKEIAEVINYNQIEKFIVIGQKIGEGVAGKIAKGIILRHYPTTEDFADAFRSSNFHDEIILLKGARRFGFEKIALLFEQKLHGTVLQINLAALTHNLREHQKLLKPSTKIMAMVKAFSYGSGSAEIASVLQFNNVAYLGVAYADEGIELRKSGITIPIMVMNAEPSSFAAIVENNLQPVLYSPVLLQQFESYIKLQGLTNYPVHLEVETGMHRLGFSINEMETVAQQVSSHSFVVVQSVFSHLAASEEAASDEFTAVQFQIFQEAVAIFNRYISYPFLKHISNSAAIARHPALQMDMVRIGIGLYGIQTVAEDMVELQPVATLLSTVAQIKSVAKGESVSYNRRGVLLRDSRIATVRIGYADGYCRRLGNGIGKMLVGGQPAPVVGSVCMDMTMVDVTDIEGVKEGDDVVVFGAGLPLQQLAAWADTIPYEIMTSVSQRVKRIYYND